MKHEDIRLKPLDGIVRSPHRSGGSALLGWALAGGLVFLALSVFEMFVLRPGLGAPEELAVFAMAVHHGTWRSWMRMGGAAWSLGAMTLALALFTPWQSIYLFNALAMLGASCALWVLARRMGGEKAAAFALALAYSAPFSFLQARTVFAYVLVPVLLLFLVGKIRRPLTPQSSALIGCIAALAWLDYEAWVFAFPALALAWFTAPKGSRARPGPLVWGLLAGGAVVAALDAPYWAEWFAQRARTGTFAPTRFSSNLWAFFFGGEAPTMGLGGLPAVPWAAWPGLLAGLVCAPLWLWLWALFGLMGLAAGGPLMEPNRAMVAWPALLLISGLGTAWLCRRLLPRIGNAWIGLALLAAPVCGYILFDRAIAHWDARIHGPSRAVFQMAEFLEERDRSRPTALGPALEPLYHPLLKRCVAGKLQDGAGGAEAWFLVPRSMADPRDARWGRWVAFKADGDPYPLYLLRPSTQARALLDQAALELEDEHRVLALGGNAQLDALELKSGQARNLWSWTAWSELRLRFALMKGKAGAPEILPLLAGRCLSIEPLEVIQDVFRTSNPGIAALAHRRETELMHTGTRWDAVFGGGDRRAFRLGGI